MVSASRSVPVPAGPAALGFDEQAIETLVERASRDVASGLLPSCQLALCRDGQVAWTQTLGDAAPGSRYVMFSCTKALVAGAVWLVIGEGLLDPSETVASIIPEFASNGKDAITVEQVMLHTSGFP